METTTQDILKQFAEQHHALWTSKTQGGSWVALPSLSADEDRQVQVFSGECATVKVNETGHKEDYQKEYWRIYNGKCAEWAIRKYLGFEAPDMEIGPSFQFQGEDIMIDGEKFGVKMSIVGQAALVFTNPVFKEIILTKSKGGTIFYLCGVASVAVMKTHNDKRLFKSANNKNKAGLTIDGYNNLIPLSSVRQFLKHRNKESKTTGESIEKTCETYKALAENEDFQKFFENYETAKKAFEI